MMSWATMVREFMRTAWSIAVIIELNETGINDDDHSDEMRLYT